jgi:menaquinone-dependent protoporphyrinogen oxidase
VRVLIAYASRHGGTQGIAERIGAVLRRRGLDAEVVPADRVRDASTSDAFVIGSGVYMGHWLKEATGFVRASRTVLANRPVWLFSSGPIGTDTVDKTGRDVRDAAVPEEIVGLRASLHPHGERVFYGAFDPDAKPVGLAERFMSILPASAREAMPRGDFRDWADIEAWANGIADELTKVPVGGGELLAPRRSYS